MHIYIKGVIAMTDDYNKFREEMMQEYNKSREKMMQDYDKFRNQVLNGQEEKGVTTGVTQTAMHLVEETGVSYVVDENGKMQIYPPEGMSETEAKQSVYKDLEKRQQNGDELHAAEKSFMDKQELKSRMKEDVQQGLKAEDRPVTGTDLVPWHLVEGTDVSYKFDAKGGLRFEGSVSVFGLVPQATQLKDGTYRCGATTAPSQSRARSLETSKIQIVCIGHEIYKDMKQRQQNGETLHECEIAFMDKHVKDMQTHGLSVDSKTGKIVRMDANPMDRGRGR